MKNKWEKEIGIEHPVLTRGEKDEIDRILMGYYRAPGILHTKDRGIEVLWYSEFFEWEDNEEDIW